MPIYSLTMHGLRHSPENAIFEGFPFEAALNALMAAVPLSTSTLHPTPRVGSLIRCVRRSGAFLQLLQHMLTALLASTALARTALAAARGRPSWLQLSNL